MIGLEILVRFDSNHRLELQQTLENLCQEQVGTAGCVDCRVYEDLTRTSGYLWQEWWRSPHDLDEYLGSVAFRTLLGAIKVLGTLESARTVELQDSTSVMGAFLADRVNLTDQPSEA